MKIRHLALLAGLAQLAVVNDALADTCGVPDSNAPWQLVFSEEFDGDSLDRGKWNTELLWGPGVIINNERQYYVNKGQFGYDPFSVRDGVLSITAIKTPFSREDLYLTRAIYNANSIELLWRAPVNVRSYDIRRDGALVASVTGGAFYDTNLREGIDYTYEVTARDADGNLLLSESIIVNTDERGVSLPERAFSLGLRASVYSTSSGEINWETPNRAARYEVYKDGVLYAELDGPSFASVYESNLQAGEIHTYRVAAFDRCDELIIEDTVTLDTTAASAPVPPVERLVVGLDRYSDTSAELSWRPVVGATRYTIADGNVPVYDGSGRSYFVDDLVPGEDRRYRVVAYAADGREVDAVTRTINDAANTFALGQQSFLSGVITSYDSFRFLYGRVEARARMPAGGGFWSAFWLLNAYYNQDQPEDPEIDIIEALGGNVTTANHAYHYRSDTDGDGFDDTTVSSEALAAVTDFSTNFHVYGVIWEPGVIIWTIDGVETYRVEGDEVSDEQMYLIANLAVGGNFPGPVTDSTPFPSSYEIDWIRVYQR